MFSDPSLQTSKFAGNCTSRLPISPVLTELNAIFQQHPLLPLRSGPRAATKPSPQKKIPSSSDILKRVEVPVFRYGANRSIDQPLPVLE